MAKNRLEIILSGQVRDFNAKLREARQEADDSFGAISSAAQSASVALGGVAIGGAALAKSFVDKAVEMQKFRATLIAVTKDVDVADESLRKMVQFASTTPFDLPGVVDAGVKLRSLQVDVDKFLPLAGDLAAVFQRDIRDSALALGRALSGSQEGVEVLNRSFGISKREMEAAGAVMKANGAVAIDSAKDLEKLEIALTNIIKQKYGGAMKEQSKDASVAFANLGDAIGQLQAALGSELTDDFASLARSITELVQEFNEIPGPTKRMIAQTVVFGTAVVGTAAAVSGLIAVFGPLAGVVSALAAKMAVGAAASSTAAAAMAATEAAAVGLAGGAGAATVATTGLTGAISAAGTALVGALAPALVVVAGGLIYLTNEQGKLNQVMEKSLEIEEKVAGFQRKQRQTILDTADAYRIYAGDVTRAGEALAEALRAAGKTDKDVAESLIALRDQLDAAEEAGNERLARDIQGQILTLLRAKEALQGTGKAKAEEEKKAAEEAKKALEEQTKLQDEYEKKAKAGFYETKKTQLEALDAVLAGMKKEGKEYETLSLSRVKLAREVGQEEKKQAEDTRKKKAEEALYELDTLKATANDNYKQRAAKLKELLNLEVLNTEERRKLELELLETNRAVQEQSLAAHRKAEEEKTKATEAQAKRRAELAESDRGLAEDEVRALKEKLARGEDVLSQLKEQVATRQKLTEEAIKEVAAVEKVGKSAADAAAIDKLAKNEIQRTRAETGREVEALDRQEADRRKKSLLEALKLQDELAQAKLAADKDVTQTDLNRSAKERLDIAKKQLRLQADIESASATPEEKARIQAQLELDLYNLRKKSTEELAAASEELEKAKKKTEELKGATLGGVQSVEEFAKELNEQFAGLGRDKPEEEASGVTEADRDKAARDLGVDRNEGVPGLDTRTEADSEPSTPGVGPSGGTELGDTSAKEVEEPKGGDLGPVVERLDALTAAVVSFHGHVAKMQPGLQVEFMTPQGTGNDDWAYRSTRVGE